MRKSRLNRSLQQKGSAVFSDSYIKTPFPTAGRVRFFTTTPQRMERIEQRLRERKMIRPVLTMNDPATGTKTHLARIWKNGKRTSEYILPATFGKYGTIPHEYKHGRNGMYGVEHGLKRNPHGMLGFIEESLFDLETMEFAHNPRYRLDMARAEAREAYNKVLRARTPTDATVEAQLFLEKAMFILQVQFASRRSFMRALAEMQSDPRIRKIMQRFNAISLVPDPESKIQNYVNPHRVKQFANIWPMLEYLERKAAEYRGRDYTSKSTGTPRNKRKVRARE